MPSLALRLGGWALILVSSLTIADAPLAQTSSPAKPAAQTGPATEKRFPPLKLPPGFKATLFACDPLVEYPSVVALGPRAGTIFVAADYMTGLGTEIVRRDDIRLLEDTDGDGYADKATVFATGFNSIQGLAYHDRRVYVMHAPFLTALCDTKGKGVADVRRDLLTGLGLPPEENPPRLHCANGVVPGHDGWLYLALGDHGCDVPRPEGDRLVLHGGGILRCRPDGRDLHVFATGLRNIYDVALDDELNVFVRDNENDGGTYMIRVCHSFFGADHGYPYLYEERPEEALRPLADLGLGSSAGGVSYLERQFPPEYQGNLFFCEWGRAVMRYVPQRAGSAFAPLKEIEFAAGADNDPYGFKPTDLIVDRDGSLIVVDWADGQRPRRGRGRVYRISHPNGHQPSRPVSMPTDPEKCLALLDSKSYHQRLEAHLALEHRDRAGLSAVRDALRNGKLGVHARLHAVWLIARGNESSALDSLFDLARSEADARVRAQAIRAIADLTDPVLVKHRLDAGRGDAAIIQRLLPLANDSDARVMLEVVLALGRLRWSEAPGWLAKTLSQPDAALAHAVMQTMRRSANWPATLKLLDEPSTSPIRKLALRAIADQAEPVLVDGLIARLGDEADAGRRREYADALSRVVRKPGSWVYWGYRPAPRPPNAVAWERTEAIEQTLNRVLADPDRPLRLAVLRRMKREKIASQLEMLERWLHDEQDAERVATVLDALGTHPANSVRAPLYRLIGNRQHTAVNRLSALALMVRSLDEPSEGRLLELAGALEDGPVLAEALRQLGKRPQIQASPLLLRKLSSAEPAVRAAAVDALAERQTTNASDSVRQLLGDKDASVRRAAAVAVGKLSIRPASETLLQLAHDNDPAVRRASLDSLRQFRDARVVPLAVAALADRDTQLTALQCIGELGGPKQSAAVVELARRNPSAEVLTQVVRVVTKWGNDSALALPQWIELERTVAEVQSSGGVLLRWQTTGPLAKATAASLIEKLGQPGPHAELTWRWQTRFATGLDGRLNMGTTPNAASDQVWLALADLHVLEPTPVRFLASSNGPWQVWLNGRALYQRDQAQPFRLDADQAEATLVKGTNHLLVQVTASKGPAEFHVRFRRKSATAEHEKLMQAALARSGNVERGRQVFLNVEKSQCLKCHRLRDQGERIGPELTGIGGRFSRIYLVESILEPSRTIAPSFETLLVALKNGQVRTGVRIAETEESLTIGDNQGQKHVLNKADIEEKRPQPVSTMPEGLEKRLTPEEFLDLIAFLVSQR